MVTQHTTRNQFEEEPEQNLETAFPLVEPVAPLEDLKITAPRYTEDDFSVAWITAATFELNEKKAALAAEEQAITEQAIARVEQDVPEPKTNSDTYSLDEVIKRLEANGFSTEAIEHAKTALHKKETVKTLLQQTAQRDARARRATIARNNLGPSSSEKLIDAYQAEDDEFAKAEAGLNIKIQTLNNEIEAGTAELRPDQKLFEIPIALDKVVFDNKRLGFVNKFDLQSACGITTVAGVCSTYITFVVAAANESMGLMYLCAGILTTTIISPISAWKIKNTARKITPSYLLQKHDKVKNIISKIQDQGLYPVLSIKKLRKPDNGDVYEALTIEVYPNSKSTETPKLGLLGRLINRFGFKKKK